MRSIAPPLAPIFRSALQGRVLAATLLEPDREWSITALAAHVSAPLTSTHNEVERLVSARILTDRKQGRTRFVTANSAHAAIDPLTQLVTLSFGAPAIIAREFSPYARRVIIFGSWVARYEGTPGPPPRDIDVLIVDATSRSEVYAAARRAEQVLRTEVNPVIRSREAWAEPASDPLLDQISRRPYLDVTEVATS